MDLRTRLSEKENLLAFDVGDLHIRISEIVDRHRIGLRKREQEENWD